MLTAAIFDLDNCLAPANEPVDALYARVFDAIRRANPGSHSEQPTASQTQCWMPLGASWRRSKWIAHCAGRVICRS
jgi:FMN phosphatase YigB (HAD superfamily)